MREYTMRWFPGAVLTILFATATLDGQAPPGTEIYLAPLSTQGARLHIGKPVNITNRPGYDNQPSFTPDDRSILFTSIRDGQADIYRYDLPTRALTRVTSTPESEYSATVIPGAERFSVIRVEGDSTQRLWSFKLDGSDPQVVFAAIRPVGYHAWVNPDAAVLFVLGVGGSENALVWADRSGRADTLARDIGRALTVIPASGGFAFVQRMPDSTWQLRAGGAKRPASSADLHTLATLPPGAAYVAWLSRDRALTATGAKLLLWKRGAPGWAEVADLTAAGLVRLSRVAVSSDGKWLALVAEERPVRRGSPQ